MLRTPSQSRPASLEDLLDTKLLARLDAISCHQTDNEFGMPANYSGLRMTDGRVLPTYDWVAESIDADRVEVGL